MRDVLRDVLFAKMRIARCIASEDVHARCLIQGVSCKMSDTKIGSQRGLSTDASFGDRFSSMP